MTKEKTVGVISSVGRMMLTVAAIIIILLGIGKKMGMFEQTTASIPVVKASVVELDKRIDTVEDDVIILKTELPYIKKDIKRLDTSQKERFDNLDETLKTIKDKL